ncbi:hypothetical protein FIBSPDRAFT_878941 [Athelia psychrophila]|uniref:Uncharacterized protein n=1 Tax=Athelia psychrophila TaxID=1759441 RepID=A0A167UJR2_9AGAM|nr:hypothetical protein FIBSPDRAFT_878941 [Fibularhizoctonia sp. CBS 109695]
MSFILRATHAAELQLLASRNTKKAARGQPRRGIYVAVRTYGDINIIQLCKLVTNKCQCAL